MSGHLDLLREAAARLPKSKWDAGQRAVAAVAELVDADIEYDAAAMTYSSAKTGSPRNEAWAKVQASIARRYAAIVDVGAGGAA